jgi:hypothetical protein
MMMVRMGVLRKIFIEPDITSDAARSPAATPDAVYQLPQLHVIPRRTMFRSLARDGLPTLAFFAAGGDGESIR